MDLIKEIAALPPLPAIPTSEDIHRRGMALKVIESSVKIIWKRLDSEFTFLQSVCTHDHTFFRDGISHCSSCERAHPAC